MRLFEVWDKMNSYRETTDHGAVNAIFTGLNVSEDFWDNFILVCNNTDGLSQLLGVSAEKIASWPIKIQEYLKKSKDHENPEDKEKTQVMNTGISI